MNNKRLFRVHVEMEDVAYVLAENEKSAEQIVRKEGVRIFDEVKIFATAKLHNVGGPLSGGWSGNCLPYGGDGKKTIDDYLKDAESRESQLQGDAPAPSTERLPNE